MYSLDAEMRNVRSWYDPFVRHLAIAWALVRLYFRVIPRDWYRQSPFLPVPPANYVQWRLRTAYGKHRPGWPAVLHDLWQFGDWLRQFPE